ncbi:MAG: hypothetical protein DHS20C15_07910 [Planctomycetota bacterium]|nr:MAG: hypothetical protein DHS20C15_07910 [Planctomycetota bacterium]
MIMLWFDRLFPAVMLSWPVLVASCVKPHPTLAAPHAAQKLRRLWIATLLALALFGGVQALLESTQAERNGLRAGWPVLIGTAGSMLLFFRFAMPALIARSPGWGGPGPRPSQARVASLQPRDGADLLPRWAMPLGWALFALSAAATTWAITRGAHPTLLLGLSFWVTMGWGCRAAAREPEPLDAQGSASLRAAYRSARRLRAWGFWSVGVAGTLCFSAVAVVVVEHPVSAGMLGGVGGSAIGLAGGVFGTMASVSRARINSALQELSESGATEESTA